jgi:hypothetical protein
MHVHVTNGFYLNTDGPFQHLEANPRSKETLIDAHSNQDVSPDLLGLIGAAEHAVVRSHRSFHFLISEAVESFIA